MNVWLGCLAAVLGLDVNDLLPFSFSKSGETLLLMGRDPATQTGHDDFFVKDRESPGHFFVAIDELGANIYVTPGSHLHFHYSTALKKLLKGAFVMEAVDVPPRTVLVGPGYV